VPNNDKHWGAISQYSLLSRSEIVGRALITHDHFPYDVLFIKKVFESVSSFPGCNLEAIRLPPAPSRDIFTEGADGMNSLERESFELRGGHGVPCLAIFNIEYAFRQGYHFRRQQRTWNFQRNHSNSFQRPDGGSEYVGWNGLRAELWQY
jgi:hypothetical protein